MSRYNMRVRVLDGIRREATGTEYAKYYALESSSVEGVWQARSRAYIHLFLMVMFGLDQFIERETFVTDGGGDGGIDGFYIDRESRVIFLMQSKFRNSEDNFENKPITLTELLSMEVRRIVGGEQTNTAGETYNNQILRMQALIADIADIGRYKYNIVILANIIKVSDDALRKISDGYSVSIFPFSRAYEELLFPVLQGTLFKATGLSVALDLSNKSAGTKISYNVSVEGFDCDITVVFVPTIEIARIMSKYKNSILRFNPRSYLEFDGERVNAAIRESIVSRNGNAFALLNNGITIICDKSEINEQSGRKHRAQLYLTN
jgi:molybdopterin converting factor small subunit